MNNNERKLLDVLKSLKEEYGVFEIKAEFEAEGSRMDELMRLKDVTSNLGMPIILKIGGVEAVTDVYNGMCLGVKGIIAPMAETSFAVSKFTKLVDELIPDDNKEEIEFAINIETITAYNNLTEILATKNLDKIQGVTIGRVDFTASMGGDRKFADSDEMLEICTDIFSRSRDKGLMCGLGGAISSESINFIKSLAEKKLVDKYETRKVVFSADSIFENPKKGLLKAIEFELLWLKSKQRFYSSIKSEDENRIKMLDLRLQKASI
jgi:hypothetical protein